jgi:SpoVK/Ycf46/Vps4 family AAA+-type ATPase
MTEHRGPYQDNAEHYADELRRLDLLIRYRLATADRRNEALPHEQAARTVYITRAEVDWLLDTGTDPAGWPADGTEDRAALDLLNAEIEGRVRDSLATGVDLSLPALARRFGLSSQELSAVVVCLAPELRRKYDRLYAYLQDDIIRKRPSVDLILELLCGTEAERWAARRWFTDTAPLLRGGILRRVDDPHSPSGSTGLAQFLALDSRICQFLLGFDGVDDRLVGRSRWYPPDPAEPPEASLGEAEVDALVRLAEHHLAPDNPDRRRLVFALHGPAGAGKRDLAREVCGRLGVPLLSLDLRTVAQQGAEAAEVLRAALREGLLQSTAVHLAGTDALLEVEARPLRAALEMGVAEFGWLVFLTGETEFTGGAEFAGTLVHPVAVTLPDLPRSTEIWQRWLAGRTPDPQSWAAELAARYRLAPGGIRAAVELAENERIMRSQPSGLSLTDIAAACRQLSNRKLADLAVRVDPRCGWEDLVLPADRVAHLRDICAQVRYHHQVFGHWGFGRKLSHGRGLSVLFSGPPGTGKTMAAEVLARDVDLDLYTVDLSGVVSKYIGETEKNLARIFGEARTSNAILFFDEADALFGKRTEVSDAHDRYANIETSYLLQKMDEYDGVVILATNLRQNLDEAFTRRIRFVVEFPFPDADSRARIWRTLFPPQAPLALDVDFAALGREYPVAGGNIKNIVLNAAFLAAADGGAIDRRHILRGTRREFEKIGKLWSEPAPISAPTAG